MTNVLIIDSAATGEASVSRGLTSKLAERLSSGDRGLEDRGLGDRGLGDRAIHVVRRDVGTSPIPHLIAETVGAIRGAPGDTDAGRRALALSDALVEEIKTADVIVIGAPMYNFGMASTLKAWFDHILRAGVTFRYSEAGPEGLVTGKRAIVIESRAGLYSEGPAAIMDHQEPHIRTLLGFIGITDVTFVRAEKLAFGPEAAAAAIAEAVEQLGSLAKAELALAA